MEEYIENVSDMFQVKLVAKSISILCIWELNNP